MKNIKLRIYEKNNYFRIAYRFFTEEDENKFLSIEFNENNEFSVIGDEVPNEIIEEAKGKILELFESYDNLKFRFKKNFDLFLEEDLNIYETKIIRENEKNVVFLVLRNDKVRYEVNYTKNDNFYMAMKRFGAINGTYIELNKTEEMKNEMDEYRDKIKTIKSLRMKFLLNGWGNYNGRYKR